MREGFVLPVLIFKLNVFGNVSIHLSVLDIDRIIAWSIIIHVSPVSTMTILG